MWKRCAEGQTWSGITCSGNASVYDWGSAIALTSNSAGHSDWRMPTENELLTIVEYQRENPAINTTIFPNTTSSVFFWSGSRLIIGSGNAWFVRFDEGYNPNDVYSSSLAVRLVRIGQFFCHLCFIAKKDVEPGAVHTSNTLQIAPGSSVALPISIVGGQYSVNNGAYTSAPGTVKANDSVTVRVTSAAGLGSSTRAILTVGGIDGDFIVTTRSAADNQPPSVPVNVTASVSSDNVINLTWGAATDNMDVMAYQVYRNGQLVTSLRGVTSFTDPGLSAATVYGYSVAACDAAGNCSAQSATASATTRAATTSTSTTPTIDFIDNGDGTVTHRITGLTLTVRLIATHGRKI